MLNSIFSSFRLRFLVLGVDVLNRKRCVGVVEPKVDTPPITALVHVGFLFAILLLLVILFKACVYEYTVF